VAPTAETVVGTVPGEVDLSKGKAEAGQEVFTNVADPACSSCHTYGPAGSAEVGPNLDEALANQDPQQVLESIVDPNAQVTSGFQPDVMPDDYAEQLSEQQLADLVAFLKPQR
jgi:mono/diheme cytochrome c family protein